MAGLLDGYDAPEAPSNEAHVPVGYNATKCFLNWNAAGRLLRCAGNSVFSIDSRSGESLYDIDFFEPVWTFEDGIAPKKSEFGGTNAPVNTFAPVLSNIVGLDEYLNVPKEIKDVYGLLNAYIMSRIRWIGFSFAAKKFTQAEKDTRSFAVMFSGIITRRVHRAVRLGDTLMLKTPRRELLTSGKYQSSLHSENSKVTLDLVPVRQVELTNFAATCIQVYKELRKGKKTESSVNHSNMALFGSNVRGYTLTLLVNAFYRGMQVGYIKPGDATPVRHNSQFCRTIGGKAGSAFDRGGKKVDTPEQLAIIMAVNMGLINVNSSTADAPTKYQYKKFITPESKRNGEIFANQFFDSVVCRGMNDEQFKFGPKDEDLCFDEKKEANGVWTRRGLKNGYDRIENLFSSSFHRLLVGISAITSLEKSMIVGTCIKDAQAGQVTNAILCK